MRAAAVLSYRVKQIDRDIIQSWVNVPMSSDDKETLTIESLKEKVKGIVEEALSKYLQPLERDTWETKERADVSR